MYELPDNDQCCRSEITTISAGKMNSTNGGTILTRGLGAHFLGALAAPRAQVIRMHAQGLGDAGSKALGLSEHRHQGFNVIESSAARQLSQSFNPGLADAHLEIDHLQFIAEFGMHDLQFLGHAQQGLIETEPCFHADDQEIQSIRQARGEDGAAAH